MDFDLLLSVANKLPSKVKYKKVSQHINWLGMLGREGERNDNKVYLSENR